MSDARTDERLTAHVGATPHERRSPNQRPKSAATLIVIDRATTPPKVLMGKRHASHKFMPGKFVFPGGRIEADDRRMPASGALSPRVEAALAARTFGPAARWGRALALTAIRETYEETGLLLGRRQDAMPPGPRDGPWAGFFQHNILPDLDGLRFVGRAITPPRRPKRFDTRFFAVDRRAIAHEVPGFVGPDKELVELVWVDIEEARRLDLPPITVSMLGELEARSAAGFSPDLPVPFYYFARTRFLRDVV